jgi:cell division protein FtsN
MVNLQKQRGSVILGFIAGVVAGLVIAVIIALIVTKSSIPYSQKYVRQGKIAESSVSASTPTDPNKPLYTTPSAEKSSPPENVAKPAIAVKRLPDPPRAAVPEDDPVAATIRRKSAVATHKIDDKGDERWTYLLQTNAYRDPAEAENERGKLALSGFDASIMQAKVNGNVLYRVRLGPFKNMEEMNQTRSRLQGNGIHAAIVRIPKK